VKVRIPHLFSMMENVRPEDRPEGAEELHFWKSVAWELSQMMKYGSNAEQPEIVLSDMRKASTQYIWEFWVNDLSITLQSQYNWHGQNVSQWKYAGAILLQNGRVSTHH